MTDVATLRIPQKCHSSGAGVLWLHKQGLESEVRKIAVSNLKDFIETLARETSKLKITDFEFAVTYFPPSQERVVEEASLTFPHDLLLRPYIIAPLGKPVCVGEVRLFDEQGKSKTAEQLFEELCPPHLNTKVLLITAISVSALLGLAGLLWKAPSLDLWESARSAIYAHPVK